MPPRNCNREVSQGSRILSRNAYSPEACDNTTPHRPQSLENGLLCIKVLSWGLRTTARTQGRSKSGSGGSYEDPVLVPSSLAGMNDAFARDVSVAKTMGNQASISPL